MKTKSLFKIFDTKEKCYLTHFTCFEDLEFNTKEEAEDYRWDYLAEGNYPDEPVTVLQIHEIKTTLIAVSM
jgi:hypothetical protein